jgi:hypothetical protein
MLNDTMPRSIAVDRMVSEARKAKRTLTAAEQEEVEAVRVLVDKLIQVDAFEKLGLEEEMGDDYVRPALRGTRFAGMPTITKNATGTAAVARQMIDERVAVLT